MRWFAIARRRGTIQEFYSVALESWWENAGESTHYADRDAAGQAVLDMGFNPFEVTIELVQEELEETGPDAADWWK